MTQADVKTEAPKVGAATVGAAQVEAPKAETKETKESTTKFVLYIPAPGFSVRFISKEDWSTIGVDLPDIEWNAANRFRVPLEEFGPKALNYLKGDGGFEIVEE